MSTPTLAAIIYDEALSTTSLLKHSVIIRVSPEDWCVRRSLNLEGKCKRFAIALLLCSCYGPVIPKATHEADKQVVGRRDKSKRDFGVCTKE